MATEQVPVLKTASARATPDGKAIVLLLETAAGEKHCLALPRNVAPEIAAMLLNTWKKGAPKPKPEGKAN